MQVLDEQCDTRLDDGPRRQRSYARHASRSVDQSDPVHSAQQSLLTAVRVIEETADGATPVFAPAMRPGPGAAISATGTRASRTESDMYRVPAAAVSATGTRASRTESDMYHIPAAAISATGTRSARTESDLYISLAGAVESKK
jgi:hypothetical protein